MLRFLPDSLKEKLRVRAGVVTARERLANLRRAGFAPRLIIDAGAFRGDWAALARDIFPEAGLLLVEPQPELAPVLRERCARLGRATHRAALLGRANASARFALSRTNSRIVAPDHVPLPGETLLDLPVRPLAEIAGESGFSACDFLKLDLQGHELEALAGAGELFGRAEVVQTEVSWIPVGGAPLVADVIAAFSARGYRPYDVFGFNHRPRDRALWQADILFVRRDSPLIASADWA